MQLRTGNCGSLTESPGTWGPCWSQEGFIHQTATANTLTMQYMVRFSHRTVQLPAGTSVWKNHKMSHFIFNWILFAARNKPETLRFSSIFTLIWINASLNPCLGWKDLLKEISPRSATYHPCWCPSSRSWPSGGPLRFSAWWRRSLSEQTRWVWLLHSETPTEGGFTPSYQCICRLCPVWQAERGSAPRCWPSICSPDSGCSRCRRWCSRCTGTKTTNKRVIICSHAGVTGWCFSLERLRPLCFSIMESDTTDLCFPGWVLTQSRSLQKLNKPYQNN